MAADAPEACGAARRRALVRVDARAPKSRFPLMDVGFLDTRCTGAVSCAGFGASERYSTPRDGGAAMTKAQLVMKLAEAGGISRKQGDEILDGLVDIVVKSVKKGESVKIPGLGIFRLRKMKARIGRNPQTGEAIKIPARKKVGFSVAKTFKETVLGKVK
jgi:DNA-binding protein HU-beta